METNAWAKLGRLLLCLMGMWLFAYVVLPTVTHLSPDARQLAEYIDESGIETGQFYYTGVEIVSYAEANARSSVYFSQRRRGKSDGDNGDK